MIGAGPLRLARLAPALVGAALLCAHPLCAREHPHGRPGAGTANPSALVAAEIAFARAVREKGQWAAFRDFADDGAVMFVPQPTLARDWLKGRAEPAQPLQWQTQAVWMSCDGALGVTRGAWNKADGSTGWFTTVWKRQDKGRGKGGYLWLLDQGDTAPAAPASENADMLSASVGQCPRRGDKPLPAATDQRDGATPTVAGTAGGGTSPDGSLSWSWLIGAGGGRDFSVSLRKAGAMTEVLRTHVAPDGATGE